MGKDAHGGFEDINFRGSAPGQGAVALDGAGMALAGTRAGR